MIWRQSGIGSHANGITHQGVVTLDLLVLVVLANLPSQMNSQRVVTNAVPAAKFARMGLVVHCVPIAKRARVGFV